MDDPDIAESAVLDAFPAHAAVLDSGGVVVKMNAAWRCTLAADGLHNPIGQPVLEICERACGEVCRSELTAAAAGLAQVLRREIPRFAFEIAGQTPAGQRWFRLVASPLQDANLAGALITHRDITEQKRTEEQLKRHQALLASAVRIAGVGSWDYNIVADRLEWSDLTLRIFGITRNAFGGTAAAFMAFVHPDDRAAVQAADLQAFTGSGLLEMEYRIIRPDGQVRMLHDRGEITFDETGTPVRSTGAVLDVTERRRTEESIRLQAHILDSIGEAVIASGMDGQITYANRSAAALYGWSHTEMLRGNIRFVTNPQIDFEQAEAILKRLERGESWSGEYVVQSRANRSFSVAVTQTPLLDGTGNLIGTIGVLSDITERKQREAALRASEEKFRTLSEAMPQLVWISGVGCESVYNNRRWLDFTGLSLEQSVGQPWSNAVHPDDRLLALKAWEQAAETGMLECEIRLRNAAGSYRWMLARALPLPDSEGRIASWLGTCTEIEELKRAEEALQRAKEAAEAASRAKSDFLANISHDIRTPMHGIIGITDVVLEGALNPEQRTYLEMVKSSAAYLLALLNDILDFSKAEAKELRLETVAFSLRNTVARAMPVFALEAKLKNVNFNWQVLPDLPDNLIGDPTRLVQTLANLVANAVKFTERGEVSVRIARHHQAQSAPHQAQVQSTLHSQIGVRFSVRDTGIGIPPEKQRLVFEPFSQADSSTTRKYGGTGLGLTIASRLADLMQGRLWVESQQGQGSTFHFDVSLGIQNAAPPPPSNGNGHHPKTSYPFTRTGQSLRILLAEDNIVNQTVAVRLLQKPGHKVTVASNGKRALAMLDSEKFDLVFMDIQMPEMDGIETAAEIRKRELATGQHIPIIAMTAHVMAGDRERCLAAGMDDYISKPIEQPEMWAAIERLLPCSVVTVTT